MASEAADHMSCPLHAWYCICWLACAAACTQDDRTGACGGARPVFEHHAVMKLSPTQWLIMYTYVQCHDVHCLSNAVFHCNVNHQVLFQTMSCLAPENKL